MSRALCKANKCRRQPAAKGFCMLHYKRFLKYGDSEKYYRRRCGEMTTHRREYYSYCHMKRRCINPNDPDYGLYGGRGVSVCDRWLGPDGFHNFLTDLGEKPAGRYSLDRIDVNDDYCPENCRWANDWVQASNQRRRGISTRGVYKDKTRGGYVADIAYRGIRKTKRFRNYKDAFVQRRQWEKEFGIEIR